MRVSTHWTHSLAPRCRLWLSSWWRS